ncbi:hypothetical protein MIND_00927100 [Mycena indigotica]|uniref:Uncharacterized protein n=1 Tax=Mycena indigotica TaxID=2126181 RepID=A0A8H6SEM8_9AGAR|nr:uncharacterized protein MIND_00927100 [Mycena indigotica]KAF7296952.1 hypothetical protein MIND_00927100 [Mycena indigotica]
MNRRASDTRCTALCSKYCAAFQMPTEYDHVRDMQEDNAERDDILRRRATWMDTLDTAGLKSFAAGVVFLRNEALDLVQKAELFDGEDDVEHRGRNDTLASTGPLVIATGDGEEIVDRLGVTLWDGNDAIPLLGEFFDGPLRTVGTTRGLDAPPRTSDAFNGVLLNFEDEETVKCPECEHQTAKLWLSEDWPAIDLPLRTYMPGRLSENITEMEWLGDITALPSFSAARVLASIAAPTKMCTGCLETFIKENAVPWLLREKCTDASRWTPPPDCPDGWDCEEQTEVTLHALEYNHLCKPTRTLPDS